VVLVGHYVDGAAALHGVGIVGVKVGIFLRWCFVVGDCFASCLATPRNDVRLGVTCFVVGDWFASCLATPRNDVNRLARNDGNRGYLT